MSTNEPSLALREVLQRAKNRDSEWHLMRAREIDETPLLDHHYKFTSEQDDFPRFARACGKLNLQIGNTIAIERRGDGEHAEWFFYTDAWPGGMSFGGGYERKLDINAFMRAWEES